MNRKYWQQACGDTERNYAAVCFKWGVVLNGPGELGPLPDSYDKYLAKGVGKKKLTDINRFAYEMKEGDIVVLRLGTKDVLGIGVIKGNYVWHDSFGDIDGWDLQQIRRVQWLWTNIDAPKKFETYALKQGDTTQQLTSPQVLDWVDGLELDFDTPTNLPDIPTSAPERLNINQISEALFDQGVSSTYIDNLSKEIDELIRIAKWYQKYTSPSEHETVTYLAVPLLRALGWTPQKMAIEWNKVDIALFNQLPRQNENLNTVVEAKKKGNSCLMAFSQAESYASDKPNCNRLIVTDGLRYGVYIKSQSIFKLHAYMNLTRMVADYPVYECMGVVDALIAMTPEWQP
ncbi:hypothetical protein [Thalassomonas sp. M1454]|uniref:hypothetical protein n=1 Tax=Thalassomonas sp. M1454 TaxID=2594477 RepID=UPI001C8F608F|nr:hypothetical protein [Thalassomonas sp. M1454]